MRQGQQNRRGRGRSRKAHHNPLTRSYESNGPDVKIRGTPSHIAEKYMSLARDALSSGDPVLAENYLQHAEHYNRIIMAFREQTIQQSGEAMNGVGRLRGDSAEDDFSEEDADEMDNFPPYPRGSQEPQPRSDGHLRFEDRPHRQSSEQARPPRERFQEPRQPQPAPQPQAAEQPAFDAAPQPREPREPRAEAPPRRRDRFAASAHEQPEFLRRPVRRPRRDANGSGNSGEANGATISKDESGDQ